MNWKILNQPGVYKIKNIITNKFYIGSSKSSIFKRFNSHKHDLRLNKHHSKALQNAWNKYGEENFIFEPLEFCEKELSILIEQFYIDVLDSYHNGYNCCPIAKDCSGRIVSQETRNKISKSLTGRKYPLIIRKGIPNPKKNKAVLQYKDGLLVGEFISQREASKALNTSQGNIATSCSKGKRIKGFIFRIKERNDTIN